MDNKQLYTISNQQRFTFSSWKVIVPYSHVHFPVYLTNPYQLTYRRAGYIRAHSYNYSIGQQTFTFDMGVHLNPILPNVQLYNQTNTLSWCKWWSSYPSMRSKIIYEGNYNNCNLPYLPLTKYQVYNNSGNRAFYDIIMHTFNRRYHNSSARSYVTSGLDTLISDYIPLTAPLLSTPSCIYYLLSPQRYHTLNLTHKGQIKTPVIYLRSLLQEYLYTTLWSVNFALLWGKLYNLPHNNHSHVIKLTTLLHMHVASIRRVNSYVCHKYLSIMYHYPPVTAVCLPMYTPVARKHKGSLRMPITQSLTFISLLQVSIPKKKLWGMGSWGVNYLEYYAPRATAAMHGTGITSKLPMNKYTRVTARGQGGRYLSSRLYKGLLVLPYSYQTSMSSKAKILHLMAPYSYQSAYYIFNNQPVTYYQIHQGRRAKSTALLSMWANMWVGMYKQAIARYTLVRVIHTYPHIGHKGKKVGGYKKAHLLPHMNRLWYNRMLPKKKANR